jgi:carboxypeptidase PM20D1
MWWVYLIWGVVSVIVALAMIVIVKTLLFVPKKTEATSYQKVSVDLEKAVNDLSRMIKCKTISDRNRNNESEEEFEKFKALLRELFPEIHQKCTFEAVGDRGLLYKLSGKSSDAPTVLMSHFDVVSVDENGWDKDPFCGEVENGILWGRGTLDTKSTLNGAMQALESLLKEGFVPENDIYLAFSGNEEINGYGAVMIVDLFEKRGITPALVLDEGGAVVNNVFPGVKTPCALIGIAEKGMLNVEFSYSGNGGHSSSPKPHTPIGRLSKACVRVEDHPFKFTVCGATKAMLNSIARYSSFAYRMIFANLWLFSPVLSLIGKLSGGELNSLVRTTCAFTQAEGSKGINVIPPHASMRANLRLIPGESIESARDYLEKTIKDDQIKVTVLEGSNPSRTSLVGTDGWNKVVKAINGTWENTIVSPYLMFACSDSRHWGRISDRVYRFSAMALTTEERATIHGNNEKIPVSTIEKTVEFYIRLIKNC